MRHSLCVDSSKQREREAHCQKRCLLILPTSASVNHYISISQFFLFQTANRADIHYVKELEINYYAYICTQYGLGVKERIPISREFLYIRRITSESISILLSHAAYSFFGRLTFNKIGLMPIFCSLSKN